VYWRKVAPTSAQEEAGAPSKQEMSKIRDFFIAQQTIVSFFTSQIVCATTAPTA
jgi:hypothetical protein